jgi:hypothetical protein
MPETTEKFSATRLCLCEGWGRAAVLISTSCVVPVCTLWRAAPVQIVSMSSDLVWMLVRNNSSFLVKRDGAQFTSEPGNLTQLNSFKFSGLANRKAVSVEMAKKKVTIGLKKYGAAAA